MHQYPTVCREGCQAGMNKSDEMAQSLTKFREQLQGLMHSPYLRPFVCEGSPLDCNVFIVGINATTKLDFWHFWTDEYGFHKEEWLKAYQDERVEKGRRPITPTRQKINIVGAELTPHRCLETNLYSTATTRANQLTKEDEKTEIFEFLLNTIRPKAIWLHGNEPIKYFQRQVNSLVKNQLIETEFSYGKVILYATHHFTFRNSFANIRHIAQNILRPAIDKFVQV